MFSNVKQIIDVDLKNKHDLKLKRIAYLEAMLAYEKALTLVPCDDIIQLMVEKIDPSVLVEQNKNRPMGVLGEPGDEFLR